MNTCRIYDRAKGPEISDSKSVYRLMKLIKDKNQELFVMLCLDTRNKVISRNILSIGTLNTSVIHPREIFRTAIMANANSIILAHNHPSGCTEPSKEDLEITRCLMAASKLMGIPILDHVIVGIGYHSMADKGELQ